MKNKKIIFFMGVPSKMAFLPFMASKSREKMAWPLSAPGGPRNGWASTWLTSEIFCDRKCKKHTSQKLSCLLRCLSLKVWAEWSKYASISIIVITKNHEITIPHISTTLSLAIAPGKSLFYHPLEQLTSRVRKPKNYATWADHRKGLYMKFMKQQRSHPSL